MHYSYLTPCPERYRRQTRSEHLGRYCDCRIGSYRLWYCLRTRQNTNYTGDCTFPAHTVRYDDSQIFLYHCFSKDCVYKVINVCCVLTDALIFKYARISCGRISTSIYCYLILLFCTCSPLLLAPYHFYHFLACLTSSFILIAFTWYIPFAFLSCRTFTFLWVASVYNSLHQFATINNCNKYSCALHIFSVVLFVCTVTS